MDKKRETETDALRRQYCTVRTIDQLKAQLCQLLFTGVPARSMHEHDDALPQPVVETALHCAEAHHSPRKHAHHFTAAQSTTIHKVTRMKHAALQRHIHVRFQLRRGPTQVHR